MSGNGDRSEQVVTVFAETMRLQPSERQRFAREKCGTDEDLYHELSEMLEWEERMGGFLRDPVIKHIDFDAAERPFQPGQTVADGRFYIVRFVAAGGMGMVYEAVDTKHDRRVAIKCPKPGFSRLLTPELVGALRVRHDNICLVNDTHTEKTDSGEVDFLTMEFLDGETLSERLSREGKLQIEEALEIARQLCAGVAAAHGSGILHKDLKSSNVILTHNKDGSSRAVITDFGLATEAHLESELEGGTPAYMAPELLNGGPATKQSDIFALGVIFYKMVIGQSPFESDSKQNSSKSGSLAIPSRIRTSSLWPKVNDSRTLVLPRTRVRNLPRRWNRTILRCLEPDPKQRFESADSVIAALEGEPLPVTYELKRAGRALRRSRETQAILLLILIVAVSWWFYRYYIQMPQIPAGTKVLVASVASSEPELSGITVALKGELQQSAHFEVEADDGVNQVLKQMEKPANTVVNSRTAREIALRCGAALVIFGVLSRTPQDYVLAMNVERAKSTPLLPAATWSKKFHARDQKELLTQVHSAALWIRRVAGESEAEIAQQDRPVEDTTTSSWQALQLLEQANQKHATGDDNAALLLLDEAIQADPQFAMAHMRKADILISQNRSSEGYREWEQAIKITGKTELTSRENFRIKGQYYDDTGDFQSAEKIFHQYVLHYPNDFLAWFYWGNTLKEINRRQEALLAFKKAADMEPGSSSAYFQLALEYLALGDRTSAEANIQKVAMSSPPEWATWLSAYLALSDGKPSLAIDRALQLRASPALDWQSQGYLLQANVLAEMGKRQDAIAVLREGIEFDRQRGRTSDQAQLLVLLAYLLHKAGDTLKASESASVAIELDQSPGILLQAGIVLARVGEIEAANRVLARLQNQGHWPYAQLASNLLAGEIEQAHGSASKALMHFRTSSRLAVPWNGREWLARNLIAANMKTQAKPVVSDLLAVPIPQIYYLQPWPGIWADSFAEFTAAMDFPGDQFCIYGSRYLALRDNADPELRASEVSRIRTHFERLCH